MSLAVKEVGRNWIFLAGQVLLDDRRRWAAAITNLVGKPCLQAGTEPLVPTAKQG